MYSVDRAIEELISKLREPDALNPARSAPVYYFAYPPEEMLKIKKHLPRLLAKMKDAGFGVRRVSLADVIWNLIDQSGRWDAWLELEPQAELAELNEAIRDVLRQDRAMIKQVAAEVDSATSEEVVILTEAELLHPFMRTRAIEEFLHNAAETCTVIFYPGERRGQFGLKFLGFYKEDSGYRSTIIGGF